MLSKRSGPILVAVAVSLIAALTHPWVGAALFAATTLAVSRHSRQLPIVTIALVVATLIAIDNATGPPFLAPSNVGTPVQQGTPSAPAAPPPASPAVPSQAVPSQAVPSSSSP